MGRERRTLRGVELQADRVAELAHRPVAQLRRRDVAIALLTVAAEDALTSLPAIRRGLLAAGNPLSAPFWDSAEAILQKISGHEATFGDVHGWLEATGTEPTAIIGLHVWEEPDARSPLQEEMHARLVGYLEERVAAGEIDPDDLATGNEEARREYLAVQERWMTTPLPDGRVPMTVLLDEQDEAFLADWAAADAEARAALQSVLETVGERPLPATDLSAAVAKLRADIARPGWPGQMLVSFSGRTAEALPRTRRNSGSRWPPRLPRRRAIRCPRRTRSSPGPWSGPKRRISTSATPSMTPARTKSPTRCPRRSPRSAPLTTSTGWRSCLPWSPAAPAPRLGRRPGQVRPGLRPRARSSALPRPTRSARTDDDDTDEDDYVDMTMTRRRRRLRPRNADFERRSTQARGRRLRRLRRAEHRGTVPARDLDVVRARGDRRRRPADPARLVGPPRGHERAWTEPEPESESESE